MSKLNNHFVPTRPVLLLVAASAFPCIKLLKKFRTPSPFFEIKQVTTSCATFFVFVHRNSSSCMAENLLVTSFFMLMICGKSCSNINRRSSFLYKCFKRRRRRSVISDNRFNRRLLTTHSGPPPLAIRDTSC